MFVKYIQKPGGNRKLILPEHLLSFFTIKPIRLMLNIGYWRKEVWVEFSSSLPDNAIYLTEGILDGFILPPELPYEAYISDREIFIGPVIAFIAVSQLKSLTPEILDKFKPYYADYQNIKGLVYVCASNSINTTDKTIEGYYFSPAAKDGESPWQRGVFPYPGAVYRRTDLPRVIYDDFIATVGDRFFNSYFFDKWDLWEWLSPYPDLKENLPDTRKLKSIKDLDEMLELYGSVYLKKSSGYKAKGIIKAHKTDDEYHFVYRLKGETICKDTEEAERFLNEINEDKGYIIQQTINVKRLRDRGFDFRVIMQKSKHMQWGCTGIIARFGKQGSIATNFLLAGYALPGLEALQKAFGFNQREAFVKEQEIIDVCIKFCKALDKCAGNYGDLGVDVVVDENAKVWILEINKLHDPKFPLYSINDTQMYYKVVTTPFEYAKALAGFAGKTTL